MTEAAMVGVYGIGVAVAAIGAAVILGINADGDGDMSGALPGIVVGVIAWPFVIALSTLSIPYLIGRWIAGRAGDREQRRRREADAEAERVRTVRDLFDRDEPEWATLDTMWRDAVRYPGPPE